MIFDIDDQIPFCNRKEHVGKTIRQIIRYDSGYLKDLFLKDERVIFSDSCLSDLKRLTKGHKDNWERPKHVTRLFDNFKTYASPYLYDFNEGGIDTINKERLKHV